MAIYYIIGLSPLLQNHISFHIAFFVNKCSVHEKVLFTKKGNQKSSINSLWDLLYPLISLPILYGSLENKRKLWNSLKHFLLWEISLELNGIPNISNIKTKINKIKFKSATGKNCCSYFTAFSFACALILSLYLHSSHPKIWRKEKEIQFCCCFVSSVKSVPHSIKK